MTTYEADATLTLSSLARARKYLAYPPLQLVGFASDFANQDSPSISGGHYYPEIGDILSTGNEFPSDTYLVGDTGRHGLAFDLVSGQASSYVEILGDAYGISMMDGGKDASVELLQHTADTAGIPYRRLIHRRGGLPPDASKKGDDCYTLIELAYSTTSGATNYRMAFRYGEEVRLQWFDGTNWYDSPKPLHLGTMQHLFATQGDACVMDILPDYTRQVLTVRIGNHVTWHKPPSGALPTQGRLRLTMKNGWGSFCAIPQRHGPVKVRHPRIVTAYPDHPNFGSAFFQANALAEGDSSNVTATFGQNGDGSLWWEATAQKPDAGDTNPTTGAALNAGSKEPARLTDGALIVPAQWADDVPGLSDVSGTTNPWPTPAATFTPGVEIAEYRETWDDNRRIKASKARVRCNNDNDDLTGRFGVAAANLNLSNDAGATFTRVLTGMLPPSGPRFSNPAAGIDDVVMELTDFLTVLDVPLAREVCFDRWCLFSAVRFLCEGANVHPSFLTRLPDATSAAGIYVPPNATLAAPYGIAGNDCPDDGWHPILGSGTNGNPKYKFTNEITALQVLQILASEQAYLVLDGTGAVIREASYHLGWDRQGFFRFEPYDPLALTPVVGFSDRPVLAAATWPDVAWVGLTGFEYGIDVQQVRSGVTLIGSDADSNELLLHHYEPSPETLGLLGYRHEWQETSGRFLDDDQMALILSAKAAQASLPNGVCWATSPMTPALQASDAIWVWHPKVNPNDRVGFQVTELTMTADANTNLGMQSLVGRVITAAL